MFVQQGKIRRIHLAREGVSGLDPYQAMNERKIRRIHLARQGVSGLGFIDFDKLKEPWKPSSSSPAPAPSLSPGALALQRHVETIFQMRLFGMNQLVKPVEAALAKALPVIAYAGSQVNQGYVADPFKLAQARTALGFIKYGFPQPQPPAFPNGFPGFTQLGLQLLGAKIPADVANSPEPAAQLFTATLLKVNRAESAAEQIIMQAHIAAAPNGGEFWDVFLSEFGANAEKLAASTADAANAAAGAAKAGVQGAADTAKALADLAKKMKRWSKTLPGGAAFAALGGVAVLGFLGLGLLIFASRK